MVDIVIVLILFWLGGLPAWPHSREWGYAPSACWGLLLITCCSCCVRRGSLGVRPSAVR